MIVIFYTNSDVSYKMLCFAEKWETRCIIWGVLGDIKIRRETSPRPTIIFSTEQMDFMYHFPLSENSFR